MNDQQVLPYCVQVYDEIGLDSISPARRRCNRSHRAVFTTPVNKKKAADLVYCSGYCRVGFFFLLAMDLIRDATWYHWFDIHLAGWLNKMVLHGRGVIIYACFLFACIVFELFTYILVVVVNYYYINHCLASISLSSNHRVSYIYA